MNVIAKSTRIAITLIFITLVTSHPLRAEKKSHEVVAIAFYNFENLFDTDDDPKNRGDDDFTPSGPYRYTSKVYRQKLHNIATVLGHLGADVTPSGPAIIGTAEIENSNVLRDLCNQTLIKQRGYKFIHFDSRDSRGIDVALLYNPMYFQVLSTRTLSVNSGEGYEKNSRTRDILYVAGILLSDTVHIFVNHWPSRRGGEAASEPARMIAANVCRRAIDSVRSFSAFPNVIVMGDFNDDPVNTSIAKVLNAKGHKADVGITDLYNPFLTFFKKGYGTLGYNDSWSLFDQIMVSGALLGKNNSRWRFYKAEVFNKPFLKYKFGQYKGYPLRSFEGHNWMSGYSDHFPSVIYLVRPAK